MSETHNPDPTGMLANTETKTTDNAPAREIGPIVRVLAQQCEARANALELKGKKRDRMTIDYFCGAAALAYANEDEELLGHLSQLLAMILCVRGYAGLSLILKPEG